MNTSKHIAARIDRETAERLARTATDQDRSVSSVVWRALREHLAGRGANHVPDHERQAAARWPRRCPYLSAATRAPRRASEAHPRDRPGELLRRTNRRHRPKFLAAPYSTDHSVVGHYEATPADFASLRGKNLVPRHQMPGTHVEASEVDQEALSRNKAAPLT